MLDKPRDRVQAQPGICRHDGPAPIVQRETHRLDEVRVELLAADALAEEERGEREASAKIGVRGERGDRAHSEAGEYGIIPAVFRDARVGAAGAPRTINAPGVRPSAVVARP